MLRTVAIVLSLGLLACSGGGKPAQKSPGDPGDGGGGGGVGGGGGGGGGDPVESATCCCETYDLETPDILYSEMPTSECKSAGGNCEATNEYCEE
jgi:hypothetical protein